MKDLFVPYEISKTLKEKGFNKACIASYYERSPLPVAFHYSEYLNSQEPEYFTNNYKNEVAAPLWQQVVDWLREEKGIMISVDKWVNENKNWYFILDINGESKAYEEGFNSYYSAFESGILKAIDLINHESK